MKRTKAAAIGVGLWLGMVSTAALAAGQTPYSYISLHGGLLFLGEVTAQQPFDDDNSVSEYGIGFRLCGAMGFQVTPHFAFENELSVGWVPLVWVTNYDNQINPTVPIWSNPATGSGTAITDMFNIIVGGMWGNIHPYIGIGAGPAIMRSETHTFNQDPSPLDFLDTDIAFASQVFVGAEISLADRVSLGARYRLQRIGPFNLYEEIVPGGIIQIDPTIWHSIELTVKFALGG